MARRSSAALVAKVAALLGWVDAGTFVAWRKLGHFFVLVHRLFVWFGRLAAGVCQKLIGFG